MKAASSKRENSGKRLHSNEDKLSGSSFEAYLTKWSFNFIKSKAQFVFLVIILGVFGVCIPMTKTFYLYVETRRAQNLNYDWPKFADAWIAVATCLILHLVKRVMMFILFPVYMKYMDHKHKGIARIERAEKGAKNAYKTVYFTLAVVLGYMVMKDLEYMPKSLFCNGDPTRVLKVFPFHKKTPYFDIFYIGQVGYHLESFLSHIGSKPKNDYVEMMLHHIITLLLIFLSYMSNYSNVGAAVMFSHDIGDVFVSIVRTVLDLKFPSFVIATAFFTMLAVWIYTRLYVFPMDILYVAVTSNNTHDIYVFLVGMLFILQVLNIYWFIMFARIAYNFVYKRTKEDILHTIKKDEHGAQKVAKKQE